jgi:RHS repeat-associated protein
MTFSIQGGFLTAVGYPDGGAVRLDTGSGGLLVGVTDASGLRTGFAYGNDGRLESRTDPTGAVVGFARTVENDTATVVTTGLGSGNATDTVTTTGGTTTYTHTDPGGNTTTVVAEGAKRTITSAHRTTTLTLAGDPRWGTDVLLPAAVSAVDAEAEFGGAPGATQTSSAAPTTTSSSQTGAAGGTASGTLTLTSARESSGTSTTSTIRVDGRIWTYAYDSATRTATATDPEGRIRRTTVDQQGRVVSTTVQGVPVTYTYDSSGRVTKITIGTGADARTWTYAYGQGTITATNPVGAMTTQTINATGAVTAVTGPLGTGYRTSLDAANRVTAFAAPGAGAYTVTWGANGLPSVQNAPAGQGQPQFTSDTYNPYGLLVNRTTGDSSVTWARDADGRVTTIDQGGNSGIALTYDTTGRLTTAVAPGSRLSQNYTGSALTGTATTIGPVTTQVSRTVDDLGRTTALSINGGASITYGYDSAGNVTTAGAMTIVRDPTTGWITGKKLGALSESLGYNQFGEPTSITVSGPSGTVATITETRDHLGRVTQWTSTAGNIKHTNSYRYDDAGRLIGETADGKTTTYTYDKAGNIVAATGPGGAVANTYDARNALQGSGSTRYTYDGSGRLATATVAGGTTRYHYDALGDLTGVDIPGKPAIVYTVDALGRRVGSTGAGGTTSAIAYLDAQRPVATYNSSGALDETYVYDGDLQPSAINGGGGLLPAYLTKSGTAYLEIPDASGGPGLVINSTDGTIADSVDRSALGVVRSETQPGFQILGFGGGIADPATGLVRFGIRDYDPSTGRWTAPDPLGIDSGSANLYQYVSGDPVNRADPRGTCDYTSVGISAGAGIGPVAGGGSIGIAWGGGQVGTYVSGSNGVGLSGDVAIGVTINCLNSDNGDKSLGNFTGSGTSVEGTVGPVSGGSDTGYDSSGHQSSHGGHVTVGPGAGLGGSAQGTFTSILCLFGCPPPPTTVCGDLGCDSSPGHSPNDPSNDGGSTGIPTSGPRSTGDPHLRTADNTLYDMQAVGEFTWATVDSGDVTVQIRQQPLKGSRYIAINTAIAMSVDGDRLELTPPAVPGEPIAVSVVGEDIPPVGTFPLSHGTTVMRTATLTTVTAKDSTTFWIRMNPTGLDIVGAFPDTDKGKVHGLVGPFTGDSKGTVQTATGTTLTTAQLHDYNTLYRTYADSWRITQDKSLFTDTPADATAFNDPTFPDRNPPPVPTDRAAAAKATCTAMGLTGGDLASCEYDVAATGDANYATAMGSASGVVPGAAASTNSAPSTETVKGQIVPGQTVSGTVSANSKKTYTFTAPAGTVAYFAASQQCDQSSDASVLWNVADSTGTTLVGSSVICDDLGRVVFPHTGSYGLVVSNSGAASAPFSVIWEESRPDAIKQLQPGQPSSGTIDKPGARDLWKVTVTAGTVAYLAADPACDTSHLNLLWSVWAEDGSSLVGSSYTCSDLGRMVFDKAGTYQVVVSSADGKTGSYRFTWEPSRPDQVKPIQPGQTVTGTIDLPGARDVWEMTVPAGTVAYLAADPSCDHSSETKLIWNVTDASGSSLIGSSFICTDIGRLVFDKAGTYRLMVASSQGQTRPYSVTWVVSRPDQVRSIQPGQTATGTIDLPGARDAWTFTAQAGQTVKLQADPSCNASTTTNLIWWVAAADGSSMVGSSFICSDLGTVTLPTAGTYRVMVASDEGKTGSYIFRWTQ